MSVYTPQQIGQPQIQQPWSQQPYGQPPIAQQMFGSSSFGQQGQFGMQGQQQLPQLVTELSLRCAVTAVSAVVEQLRMDPQILMGIQAQGQIPPHAWSNVLTECARRIAPVVHTTLAQITGQGQAGQYGQQFGQSPSQQPQGQAGQYGQQFGQFPSQQPQGQFGQLQGQGQFGQQPQYGQLSQMGM
ncbi:hypothetical protein ACH492_08435 [Streptomyces sp. NPDC019443]|uniref:hypothetical protein n=1 Tax=Streptomyces sp. NPDC019443 TaxID=3365061 RepID=UPI003792E1F2